MHDDPHHAAAAEYALGVLDEADRGAFEAHLAECSTCADVVEDERALVGRLGGQWKATPPPDLKAHVLELAEAPRAPVDVTAYTWDEVLPGVRFHTLRDEPARGMRTALVWASPGARYPTHRHLGDEEILVLQGALRDHRGIYRVGDVCRSRGDSVHAEEVHGDEECVCFVVYHGGHEGVPE